jgi:hypothetical protein
VADPAFGPGAAAMEVHDLADAGQAYAGAGERARGVQARERGEELAGVGGIEASAVVASASARSGVRRSCAME